MSSSADILKKIKDESIVIYKKDMKYFGNQVSIIFEMPLSYS